jgi:hypothetical protein
MLDIEFELPSRTQMVGALALEAHLVKHTGERWEIEVPLVWRSAKIAIWTPSSFPWVSKDCCWWWFSCQNSSRIRYCSVRHGRRVDHTVDQVFDSVVADVIAVAFAFAVAAEPESIAIASAVAADEPAAWLVVASAVAELSLIDSSVSNPHPSYRHPHPSPDCQNLAGASKGISSSLLPAAEYYMEGEDETAWIMMLMIWRSLRATTTTRFLRRAG